MPAVTIIRKPRSRLIKIQYKALILKLKKLTISSVALYIDTIFPRLALNFLALSPAKLWPKVLESRL